MNLQIEYYRCPHCGYDVSGTLNIVLTAMRAHEDKCIPTQMQAPASTKTWPDLGYLGPSTVTHWPTPGEVTVTSQTECAESAPAA